jgi:hypothetical protein
MPSACLRISQSSSSVITAPECGMMRLIFSGSSIAGLCSGLSRRRPRVRARFSRVHLAQKWAPNQAVFLSLRMTMKSSEGGGGNA